MIIMSKRLRLGRMALAMYGKACFGKAWPLQAKPLLLFAASHFWSCCWMARVQWSSNYHWILPLVLPVVALSQMVSIPSHNNHTI